MDYNKIFNFTSYISEKNLLFEEIKIKKFFNNYEIKDKKISKKLKDKKKFFVLFNLENNKKIMFKDFPCNFLLTFGYLIGEETELVEVKFKEINERIIIKKKHMEYFSDEIENVFDSINPKDLFLKKIKNTYEISPYLNQIKNYIGNVKKINLDKIHIIKGNKMELFNPTTKFSNFKLAKIMNIPLVSMIKDNFIIDSNINIYDYNTLFNEINPIKVIEEETRVEKINNKNIYRDISQDYFIKINIKEIINKLDNIDKTNIDTSILSNELINYKKLQISSNNGKYILPFFKEKNNRKYYPIKSKEEFFELSGVYFKDDEKILQRTLLSDEKGDELLYKGKYLNSKLEFIFEKKENIDSEVIKFENNLELLLKLIVTEKPKELIKVEKITQNNQEQLEVFISKILDKLIKGSISNNSIPKYITPEKDIEKIFSNLVFNLKEFKILNDKNYISLNEFVKNLNNLLYNVNFILNKVKIEEELLSHLMEILIISVNFLEIENIERSKNIKIKLKEYFGNKKIKYYDKKFNIDEDLLSDIVYTWKLYKTKELKIIIKNKEIKRLLPKIEEIEDIIFEKKYKTKNQKLKKIFPYNYKEIYNEISSKDLTPGDKIKLKNQTVELKEDFFKLYEYKSNSKVIINNEFYKLILFDK